MPKLGLSEFCHLSMANRFFPFDIIATLNGRRVLADVTTAFAKSPGRNLQKEVAGALRMPSYFLFVKPDFSKYELEEGKGSKTVNLHVAGLVPIEQ